MRPRITVYMALSLDGFYADSQGRVDWLNELPVDPQSTEDYGYAEFLGSVDLLAMGRKTFDMVRGFGTWPYGDLAVAVISNHPHLVDTDGFATVSVQHGSPADLLSGWERSGIGHVYLDGGRLVQSFHQEGLVDEFILTQIPVLLGSGLSLFKESIPENTYRLASTQSYPSGMVQRRFARA